MPSVSPQASGATAHVPLEPRWAGRWRGAASVYGAVVEGRQTYTRWEVSAEIQADGAVSFEVRRGRSSGVRIDAPGRPCAERGVVAQDGEALGYRTTESTCGDRQPGATARVKSAWIGDCRVQWDTVSGRMPYDVTQIALSKEGCKK